jgi:hypothetical protein
MAIKVKAIPAKVRAWKKRFLLRRLKISGRPKTKPEVENLDCEGSFSPTKSKRPIATPKREVAKARL